MRRRALNSAGSQFGTARRVAASALLVVGAGGCLTLDPETAKPLALPASTPRVLGAGGVSDRAHAQLVASFGGAYRSPRAERILSDISRRLVAASDEPGQSYQVTVLNSPTINAFALPTGRLYVTRGLLALANDTSEIAAVLSHEIAHVTAKHANARGELERNADLVSKVSADLLNDTAGGDRARARSRLTIASFSRLQELEADQIGVRTMARAGYDPYGSVRFLTSLGRSGGLRSSGAKVDFLATHPTTPERVQKALLAARQIGGPGQGESNREGWLRAIEGMAYGDDRGGGVIRGRRFISTASGYGFSAPEGFTLEANGQVVIGRGAGGLSAMRFDRVARENGQTPEDYLRTGLLEGVIMEDVRPLNINGLAAATGIGRSKDWSYRLAVIEMDGSIYRLLFSAQSLSSDVDGQFIAAIESFNRLSSDDARTVKPTQIGLVTAGTNEDAVALARHMTSERALERFSILNGLDGATPIRPGELYKIIVE